MRIELETLEATGKFSQVYAPGQLLFEEIELVEPVAVSGRARRKNGDVELRGELHTKVSTRCGRCLKPVELQFDVKFAERFVPAVSWRHEEQHELQEEELNISVFDGEGIELDELVKEEILLAMPGHVLCSEDCKGLCPSCGVDRNSETCDCEAKLIDSRWEKLKDLRS